MNDTATVDRVLGMRRWAVVGATPHFHKPSGDVPATMQRMGWEIVPVNPGYDEVLGERCWPTLAEVPGPVDVVDLFRRSEDVGPHVDEAVAVGAKAVWFQLGIVDDDAAARAEAAGLLVVRSTCPKIELPALGRTAPD